MKREDIPIKTCDEIKESIAGCPTPSNANEQVVGGTIFETVYRWVSRHPAKGHVERRVEKTGWGDDKIHTSYTPSRRPRERLEAFLEELQRTDYEHRDIRDAWAELFIAKMFPTNAYIYDDTPVDLEALEDERRFMRNFVYRIELMQKARDKAISRACQKARETTD